jgi:hypothetical protein
MCVEGSAFCDGMLDCPDQSDEANCGGGPSKNTPSIYIWDVGHIKSDSFVYKYVKEINVGYPNRIICKILHRKQDILVNIESEPERNSYEQYRCAEI